MAPDRPVYKYREDVLAELWKYGVRPTEHTPPTLARGFINELYKYELRKLRDRLKAGLQSKLDEVYINGSLEHRLPNNLNMSFAYVEGESLLMGINDIAVSSGSACTSATLEPSYVLKALGVGEDLAHTSIRFGLGRFNTEEEVDYVTDKLVQVVTKLRELSPLYEMAKEGIDISKMNWQTA